MAKAPTNSGDGKAARGKLKANSKPKAKPRSKAKTKAKPNKSARKKSKKATSGGRLKRSLLATLRFLVYWSIVAAVWVVIAGAGLLIWYAKDLPDVGDLAKITRQPTVTLITSDGKPLASFGDLYGESVQLRELPDYLPAAVLSTEDRRFYDHFGLDVKGLTRAIIANIQAGRIVQGGSTITQQLAKNLFLTPARTVKRKAQEVMLAIWLESEYSKEQILTLYLNRVYLGSGTYGVEAAARKYFNKSARKVSLGEAAMLAGLLKAPSRYAPTHDLKAAQGRSKVVLAGMVDAGYLDAAVAQKTGKSPATLRRGSAGNRQSRYFADWVLAQVPDFVGHANDDLTIVTTLDTRLQRSAEKQFRVALAGQGAKLKIGQGAMVVMTPTGAIRAMIGGRNYDQSQFNRATRAYRQPGSAFKPIVFLAGLEAGLTPGSSFIDKPTTIGKWTPKNYSGRYLGQLTMKQALAKSINTVAAQVINKAGVRRVQDAALRLGIKSKVPNNLSIALGSGEVNLMELTTSYAAFAAEGKAAIAHGIQEIRDKRGQVIYRRSGGGGSKAMTTKEAAQMNEMLQAVITDGTGKAARLDRPSAGKTGTSQDYRDAWFIGYTKQYVAGVWFGNDDGRPMKGVTGGGLPARTWRGFMAEAHKGVAATPFETAPAEFKGFLDRLLGNLSGAKNAGGSEKEEQSFEDKPSR
jgi:penicillin-binding protein 1A